MHLVGFIIKKFVTMHGHMNVKKSHSLLYGTFCSVDNGTKKKMHQPRRPKGWEDKMEMKISCRIGGGDGIDSGLFATADFSYWRCPSVRFY
jgi:hypothetical protein